METLKILITILFVLVCIIMSALILMQEGNENGLGVIAGGSSSGSSYLDKNKGRTKQGKLQRFTKYLAILFLILSAVLNLNFDRTSASSNNATAAPAVTSQTTTTESPVNTDGTAATDAPVATEAAQ